jgi:hypothetical protein
MAAKRVTLVRRMPRCTAWTLIGATLASGALFDATEAQVNLPGRTPTHMPTAEAEAAGPQQGRFPHPAHKRLFPLCSGCHAAAEFDDPAGLYPPASQCVSCHDGTLLPRVPWTPPAAVAATFDHAAHGRATRIGGKSFECTECHSAAGVARLAAGTVKAGTTCAVCHTAHRAAATCLLCHAPARVSHDRYAHASCDRCHKAARIDALPHTRNACLLCHSELKAHAAPRNCVDCHPVGRSTRVSGARLRTASCVVDEAGGTPTWAVLVTGDRELLPVGR